jgi:maltooligosyltrehalose trehalohydrolase
MPFGTEIFPESTVFHLYAPGCREIRLELNGSSELLPMYFRGEGWYEREVPGVAAGSLYRFVLPDGERVPDPASRFQPQDCFGPSEVIDPRAYRWNDVNWRGRPWEEMVLYELHVGAFTEAGSFRSAMERLDHLEHLGITGIELMPMADFPGERNWGYDGVLLFAPDSVYGRPEDLKAFIDAAHARGIAVIFDVVYNHLGAEGNLIPKYWPQFYSPVHENAWGKVPNFDAEGWEQLREFIVHNALYWLEEFHGDGLRVDASNAMVDCSSCHILDEISERVRSAAGERPIHLILEDEHVAANRLLSNGAERTKSYTAQWNHQMANLRELPLEAPQYEKTEIVARMVAFGFGGMQGEDAVDCRVPSQSYVSFLQTHDLVGNDLTGQRIYAKAPVAAIRALSAIYLLVPQIPMLFMGDEWGASTPFPFFCDFRGDLAQKISSGRLKFLQKLGVEGATMEDMPDPLAPETFHCAHLDWSELEQAEHAEWLAWYRRILQVRREEIVPLLRSGTGKCGGYEVIGPGQFVATWTLATDAQLTLEANLSEIASGGFCKFTKRVLWLEGREGNQQKLGPWAVRWLISP